MNEYFQNAGKKASVETIYADVTRPDADRLEMSDYVKGTYRLGKDSYEFWANVETGSFHFIAFCYSRFRIGLLF